MTRRRKKRVAKPEWMRDGQRVLYAPVIGREQYAATIDGDAWQLGALEWVANLRDLASEYTARFGGRTRVNAAYLQALTPIEKPNV